MLAGCLKLLGIQSHLQLLSAELTWPLQVAPLDNTRGDPELRLSLAPGSHPGENS